jgi:hypothetical protein
VRPRAGVEHGGIGQLGQPVQVLHVLGLAVGLKEAQLEAEVAGIAGDPCLQLVEGEVAVVLARPSPEHVEVDSVQDLDPVAGTRAHVC